MSLVVEPVEKVHDTSINSVPNNSSVLDCCYLKYISTGGPQMARYKHYDYNQLMMVPVSLEEQLMPGTLEYAIHHVVEERLDLSIFDDRYSNG